MENQKAFAVSGSCICGRVRYEVENVLGNTVICYCNSCRKATGSLFMANSFVAERVSFASCRVFESWIFNVTSEGLFDDCVLSIGVQAHIWRVRPPKLRR